MTNVPKFLFAASVLVALAGCKEEVPPGDPQADPPPITQSSEGVQPILPSGGPVAPVSGGESVTGAGSGVGQAAKDKARSTADSQSHPPRPDDD